MTPDADQPPEPLPGMPTGVTGEHLAAHDPAADGADLAPAPPDADRPQERRLDEDLVAQEAAAAAVEAAMIGGRVPQDADDPAMDPVYQAGGGEQEGWEAAEADLIENATHGDGHGDPLLDAISPEVEADRSGAVYGETNRLPSTEIVDDPNAGEDDPGEGPGLAADRGPGLQPRSGR